MPEREVRAARPYAVGDQVLIPCTVVQADPHTITVLTDPVDLPGAPGYRQQIILHHCQGPVAGQDGDGE